MKWPRVLYLTIIGMLLLFCMVPKLRSVPADGGAEISVQTGEQKFVALTFDDGPRADTTSRLLDGLRERGASATFFLVGEQISANADLVQRMKSEGHQVGNHTWEHEKLQGLDDASVREQVEKTDRLLQELLGEDTYWVRPPYGLLDESQQKLFSVPLIHWSVDPEDWKLRNADADVRAVLRDAGPGDIILMHDTVGASVDAALRIVDRMQAEGYLFVTVEELLALYGVDPQPGVFYQSAEIKG